jgi:hypothetical protein
MARVCCLAGRHATDLDGGAAPHYANEPKHWHNLVWVRPDVRAMMMGRACLLRAVAALAGAGSTWDPTIANSNSVFTNGNRDFNNVSNAAWVSAKGVQSRNSGAYYFEVLLASNAAAGSSFVGLAGNGLNSSNCGNFLGSVPESMGIFANSNSVRGNTPFTIITSGSETHAVNDVIQVAVDFTSGSVWLGKNNTWRNGTTPSTGATTGRVASFAGGTTLFPATASADSGNRTRIRTAVADLSYTPPSGFSAWL